jgi:hypothetical protein
MYSLALDQHSASAELGLAPGDAVVLAPLADGVQEGPSTPVGLRSRR